ncbi:hypothetical protein A2U01_0073466, partial [Trifolium medium]|nr:hypothetical protein [Trifolium medium]
PNSKAEPQIWHGVARRHISSPGETVAICRHSSPETLELSGPVSLGARRVKASERF